MTDEDKNRVEINSNADIPTATEFADKEITLLDSNQPSQSEINEYEREVEYQEKNERQYQPPPQPSRSEIREYEREVAYHDKPVESYSKEYTKPTGTIALDMAEIRDERNDVRDGSGGFDVFNQVRGGDSLEQHSLEQHEIDSEFLGFGSGSKPMQDSDWDFNSWKNLKPISINKKESSLSIDPFAGLKTHYSPETKTVGGKKELKPLLGTSLSAISLGDRGYAEAREMTNPLEFVSRGQGSAYTPSYANYSQKQSPFGLGGFFGTAPAQKNTTKKTSSSRKKNSDDDAFDVFGGLRKKSLSAGLLSGINKAPTFMEGLKIPKTSIKSPININKKSLSTNLFAGMQPLPQKAQNKKGGMGKRKNNDPLVINDGTIIPFSQLTQIYEDKAKAEAARKGKRSSSPPTIYDYVQPEEDPKGFKNDVTKSPSDIRSIPSLDKFFEHIQGKGLTEHQKEREEIRIERMGGFFGNWKSKPLPLKFIAGSPENKKSYMLILKDVEDATLVKKLTVRQQEEQDKKDVAKITGQQGLWTNLKRKARIDTAEMNAERKQRETKEAHDADLIARSKRPSIEKINRDIKSERAKGRAYNDEYDRLENSLAGAFAKSDKTKADDKKAMEDYAYDWKMKGYHYQVQKRKDEAAEAEKESEEETKHRRKIIAGNIYTDMVARMDENEKVSDLKREWMSKASAYDLLKLDSDIQHGNKRSIFNIFKQSTTPTPWLSNYTSAKDKEKEEKLYQDSPGFARREASRKYWEAGEAQVIGVFGKAWNDLQQGRKDRGANAERERGFLYGGGKQPVGLPGRPKSPTGYYPGGGGGYRARPNPLRGSELLFFGRPFGIPKSTKRLVRGKLKRIKAPTAAQRRKMAKGKKGGFFSGWF